MRPAIRKGTTHGSGSMIMGMYVFVDKKHTTHTRTVHFTEYATYLYATNKKYQMVPFLIAGQVW